MWKEFLSSSKFTFWHCWYGALHDRRLDLFWGNVRQLNLAYSFRVCNWNRIETLSDLLFTYPLEIYLSFLLFLYNFIELFWTCKKLMVKIHKVITCPIQSRSRKTSRKASQKAVQKANKSVQNSVQYSSKKQSKNR